MNAITKVSESASAIVERVIINGDLSKLTPAERISYYNEVCKSVGLNPLTKPFDYISLNGKLTLYALRACTDQLRSLYGVSVEEMAESEREGVFIVTAKVKNADGRTDIAKGAVNIAGLKGENLANAMMKAETKAKRRATLSLCGLGWLDESEVDSIPGAVRGESGNPQRDAIHTPKTMQQDDDVTEGVKNWCAKQLTHLSNCTEVAEVTEWEELNADALDRLRRKALPAWSELMKAKESRIGNINLQGVNV